MGPHWLVKSKKGLYATIACFARLRPPSGGLWLLAWRVEPELE